MIDSRYEGLLSDDVRVHELAKEILERGHAELPKFLDTKTSQRLHELISDRANGNKKGEQLAGTVAPEIAQSDEVLKLCQRIHDARCDITGEQRKVLKREKQVFGLPYKDGRARKRNEETSYHYDGAYINLLLPLVLPKDCSKGNGGLILFPNLRTKFSALVSKIFSRLLRHIPLLRRLYGYTYITYDVDALYLFFGDRSLHGVEPVRDGERLVMTINSHW